MFDRSQFLRYSLSLNNICSAFVFVFLLRSSECFFFLIILSLHKVRCASLCAASVHGEHSAVFQVVSIVRFYFYFLSYTYESYTVVLFFSSLLLCIYFFAIHLVTLLRFFLICALILFFFFGSCLNFSLLLLLISYHIVPVHKLRDRLTFLSFFFFFFIVLVNLFR